MIPQPSYFDSPICQSIAERSMIAASDQRCNVLNLALGFESPSSGTLRPNYKQPRRADLPDMSGAPASAGLEITSKHSQYGQSNGDRASWLRHHGKTNHFCAKLSADPAALKHQRGRT